MRTVSVCGFAYNIICVRRFLRRAYKRLFYIAQISREKYRSFDTVLLNGEQNVRRSEQMACIGIPDLYSVEQLHVSPIACSFEKRHGPENIIHGIQRNMLAPLIRALALAVSPLSFHLLYMGGILQHDIAKLAGRFCRIDRSAVSIGNKERQLACMIDMRVCHDYRVYI